jgi:hypothetical protein
LVPPEKLQKPGGEGPIYRPIQYPEDIQAALAQVTKTIATPLQKSQTVSFGTPLIFNESIDLFFL